MLDQFHQSWMVSNLLKERFYLLVSKEILETKLKLLSWLAMWHSIQLIIMEKCHYAQQSYPWRKTMWDQTI